jgi:hypothetical protein
VNQHGKKKVNAHTSSAYLGSFSFLIIFSAHQGRWNHRFVILGTIPKICNQTYARIIQTTIIMIEFTD